MRGLRVVGRTAGSGKANMPENSRSCGKEMWPVDNDKLRAALQLLAQECRTVRGCYWVSERIALLAAEKPPATGFMTLSEGIEQGRREGYAQGYACASADRVRELSPAQAEVEYFRKILMEHFHDKLSMDEIADCAYAMSERTGPKVAAPPAKEPAQPSKGERE